MMINYHNRPPRRPSEPVHGTSEPTGLVDLLVAWCQDLAGLLRRLDAECYACREQGASIGEHIRHGLDHMRALVLGIRSGVIDFEQRRHGWAGERDPALAIMALARVVDDLHMLRAYAADTPLRIRCCADPSLPPLELTSSWGRELLNVLSHEVHHAAILRPRLEAAGLTLPSSFGVAPSTVAYRQGRSCAA